MTRQCRLTLNTDPSERLESTSKFDEVLKGPFGTLYASKVCAYNSPLRSGDSGVSIGLYFNELEHEIPDELSSLPDGAPPLTSLSLVRIFWAEPEYVVVSANYEATGKFGSLDISKTKGGDSVSGANSVSLEPHHSQLRMYGIPTAINVEQYIGRHRLAIVSVELAEVTTMLYQIHGFGKIIRQDELTDGKVVASRFFRPSVTEEEAVLNPVCEARVRQGQANGFPTVN